MPNWLPPGSVLKVTYPLGFAAHRPGRVPLRRPI